jgi:hypothetical protein
VVAPPNRRSITHHDDVFQLEIRVRIGGQRLPERQAGVLPFDARTVRGRLDTLHHAVVGHELSESIRFVVQERVIEAAHDFGCRLV